jgi:integrase/recombinase XerD
MSSDLYGHVDRYLAVRRAVGHSLTDHERMLASFVDYLETRGAEAVTVCETLAWANTAATPGQVTRRLTVVRGFARYLQVVDTTAEIPPAGIGPRPAPRPRTHLYSAAEVAALTRAARALRPELWAASFVTLIGLLAATGLRPGEAYRLQCADVDLDAGQLAVIASKAGRSRQIPLHPTTIDALCAYRRLRDQTVTAHTGLFVAATGVALQAGPAAATFRRLRAAASITPLPGERPARLYDFRHSFAVDTLLDWHRCGVDVQRQLPVLSAYLGHLRPAHTYWYLHATPELFAIVAERLADTWEPQR